MADFVIIPDTACDLVKPLRERFGIDDYISGLIYFPDGRCEPSDLDWVKYDPKEFFDSMRDKKAEYKTSCAPMGDILEVFERHLRDGKDILCITLSGGLSGTFQTCEIAAKQLMEQYPERKIICIDSLRYSTALAMLAIEASKKRAEGWTIEEVAAHIEKNKHRLHQIGPMDDLFFLCKTGRITNFKAFFGTLVGINPMADFSHNGMAQVLGKFKGKKAALDGVIAYMRATVQDPENQIMFITHSNRLAVAETLRDMIIEEFHPKEVIISHVGMSCGVSVGPGLCAAFYWGDAISEDMSKEKAIMENIIGGGDNK